MKLSELIEILYSCDEEEVFLEDEDGWLQDIQIEHVEETFDGFDTVHPACIKLKVKKK